MKVTDLFASNWLSPAAEKKQILFWVLAITFATLICFEGCIRNGYVIDDALIVENNPNAATLKRAGYVLTHEHWGSLNQPINPGAVYRPITMISFQATSTVWGNSAPAHHAVNLALHLCNSLLVAACVLIFCHNMTVSGLAGLIFAIHPLHTEVVNLLVGRAELLAFAGVMGTLLLFQLGVEKNNYWFFIGAGLVWLIGLLAKESAILFLPLALTSWWWLVKMEPGTFFSGERLKRVLTQHGLPLLGFTLPLGMYLTLRGMVLGNPLGSYVGSSLSQRFAVHPILNPLYSLPFAGRWKTALVLGGKYIGLHLWPNPLLPDYSFDSIPLAGTVLDLRLAGTIITLIGMATAIWFLREQAPLVSAGLFFWLGGIFFFSNLFFTFGTIFAERLMYLPSIGFCVAVASAGWAIGQKFPRFSLPLAAIGLLTVTFSVWQCHHHTLTFRDSLTTICHLLEQGSPRNAWAWSSLGNELAHNNRASEATAAYEKSLAILPNPEIYDTLATTYASLNQWDKSVQASQNAVKMAPEWWPFRKRLAVALTQTGHTEEAMREFGIALQAAPQDSLMQLSLASLLKRKGDWAGAETHYLAALAGDHPLPVMWRGLGDTYVAQGKQDQAQTAYENFLKTNPPRPEAEKVQEQLNRSRKLAPEK